MGIAEKLSTIRAFFLMFNIITDYYCGLDNHNLPATFIIPCNQSNNNQSITVNDVMLESVIPLASLPKQQY